MNELNLAYLLKLFLHRLYIIIITAVVFAASAFGYCKFIATPTYSATSQIIVSNGSLLVDSNDAFAGEELYDIPDITTQDIQASIYLAEKFVSFLETQDIYRQLESVFDGKYTSSQLQSAISVSLKKENDIFINISAKSASMQEAVKIANTFASIAPDYLKSIVPGAQVQVTITAQSAGKVYPKTVNATMVAFLAGAIMVYAIILIVDMNDKTIKGDIDFTDNYNIPLLGIVPDFENNANTLLGGYEDESQESND